MAAASSRGASPVQRLGAAGYDRVFDHVDPLGVGDHRRRLVEQAAGEVLEIGAGTGRNLVMFRQHLRAAGLPAIRLHDLRHSYATAALAAGIPAKVVSERLGHATIAITMDTYSHVLPGLDERAAATVARLILEGHEAEPGESH